MMLFDTKRLQTFQAGDDKVTVTNQRGFEFSQDRRLAGSLGSKLSSLASKFGVQVKGLSWRSNIVAIQNLNG